MSSAAILRDLRYKLPRFLIAPQAILARFFLLPVPLLNRFNIPLNFHSTCYSKDDKSSKIGPPTQIYASSSLISPSQPSLAFAKELMISFTCKVCHHRSSKKMSRQAYDHGVVIVQCTYCENRHLIADHLGWFRDQRTTIETLMAEKGELVKRRIEEVADGKDTEAVLEWVAEEVGKVTSD
ncbi:hypothetical protein G9A89_013860 [Geosiphon pyriformis]|nr:hypothetical protein G9A89_013860 [Geosiphon pyriformis]